METSVINTYSSGNNGYPRWTAAQLKPFIDLYRRNRQLAQEKPTPQKSVAQPVKASAQMDELQPSHNQGEQQQPSSVSQLMLAQKKKVLLKRESDKTFGFLKVETSLKTESKLKMRRMLKNNNMGNDFDLSEKLVQQHQIASNYFGRANQAANQNQDGQQAKASVAPKTPKKTLQLNSSSRRKRQPQPANSSAEPGQQSQATTSGTGTILGKRHRSLNGRRMGGSGAVKSFKCHLNECGKVFNDRASLKKHMTVHGDKLFQCHYDGCEKRFLDNAKLKRHMLVHTGEKPYSCNQCGKKFSLDFNLKTHQRIHTGEKPFSCSYPGCHKRFNQKSNLHAHQQTHHLEDQQNYALQTQLQQFSQSSRITFGKPSHSFTAGGVVPPDQLPQQLCAEHSFLGLDASEAGIDTQGVLIGEGGKLSNSNEKLEKRYKEIIKENDGKLFEVHQKKGANGQLLTSAASASELIRQLSIPGQVMHPLMIEQVLQRSFSQGASGGTGTLQANQGQMPYEELLTRHLLAKSAALRTFPLFSVQYTPRGKCKLHAKILEKEKAKALAFAQQAQMFDKACQEAAEDDDEEECEDGGDQRFKGLQLIENDEVVNGDEDGDEEENESVEERNDSLPESPSKVE